VHCYLTAYNNAPGNSISEPTRPTALSKSAIFSDDVLLTRLAGANESATAHSAREIITRNIVTVYLLSTEVATRARSEFEVVSYSFGGTPKQNGGGPTARTFFLVFCARANNSDQVGTSY